MKKTIVIFSNPFGYGPTGKAIAIAEAFINAGYNNVLLAGSNFTQEIIPSSITTVNINERNENEIAQLLRNIPDPVVISSQNRFAIKMAKSLKIPSAFLDGLAWFWKNVPHDHLIADEVFWMNYPTIQKKVKVQPRTINIVPAIISVKPTLVKKHQALIHIGGCKNPLIDDFPKHYLTLLAEALIQIDENILVTGGVEAIEYLKNLTFRSKNNIQFVSLKHHEFIKELGVSTHFITTAGQTATLEAFTLEIPTSFLMPMNLSQLALTEMLSQYNAVPQELCWNSYINKKTNLSNLKEKDAMIELDSYAEYVFNNSEVRLRLIRDIRKTIQTVPDIIGQRDFIKKMGISGANEIRDILIRKWNLDN